MKTHEKTIIYSAEKSNQSLINHLISIIKDLPQSHELGVRLFKRNLAASYRQSFLGFGWALLPPFATAGLWIFLRGNSVVSMPETGISYPVFILTGTMLWQIFSEAISAPMNQMIQNKSMITKINIPREGILLSGMYELLFNIAIKMFLLLLIYGLFQQQMTLSGLVLVPLGLFAIGVAGMSIGLILTPLGLLYQDFSKGLAVLLPFFMYLTPVIFPVPEQGNFRTLMNLNPLTTLITQTRNWLTAQPATDFTAFLALTLVFVVLLLICLVGYRLSMPMIIERMGS